MKNRCKVFAAALAALLLGAACAPAALAEGDLIEVNEDIAVSADYDWTRFADDGITLNVYNWGLYISDGSDESVDVLSAFEELTGIEVNYTTFDSNESLYAKMKSGGAVYDVIFPSEYMVGKMAAEGMLAPLDYTNIPNFANIGSDYTGWDFDPENTYSVPYTWGTTGLIYNTTLVDEAPTSWAALWDVQYANNVLMFNNSRDAYAIAAKKIGRSLNPQSVDELTEVMQELKDQKSVVQAYVMDEIFDKMEGGEAAMAPYYAGDALTMIADNPDLAFVHPSEGVNFFVDSMCVPANSKNKAAAELFINYMCEPSVGLANCDYIGYSTPITAVWEQLDDELKYSEIAYPGDDVMGKAEVFTTLPDEINAALDAQWSEMKSYEEGGSGWMVVVLLLLALVISFFNIWRKLRKKARDDY
ncbi:MAG TPA: spermidine/putrescine ABC transporter substrate-binding protein [Candidatus Gemmiger excrementipullorum]|uniref:Spermidine/putrescine ABC transporter substrate-binding protein n=1 Tax=Candidatus Gemmiger excrementipullorum TaxID=2838610 RepID=A0A9D2BTI2_9FIRM|nr:spermidine/putrescine ABC transporter substrate-binding protein [Candidatus Gemmiger excrementipullorum]